jgi:uncharacterized coiled-coil DUF342 family protein
MGFNDDQYDPVLKQPTVKQSSDAEWRAYYEKQSRELRKENAALAYQLKVAQDLLVAACAPVDSLLAKERESLRNKVTDLEAAVAELRDQRNGAEQELSEVREERNILRGACVAIKHMAKRMKAKGIYSRFEKEAIEKCVAALEAGGRGRG